MPNKPPGRSLSDDDLDLKLAAFLLPLTERSPLKEALERWECIGFWLGEDGRPEVGYVETESLSELPRRPKVGRYDH